MHQMTDFLPFAMPDIGEEEISAVVDCMRSGWLTTGPKAREFEAAFAAHLGAKHAVAVNSATAGLHLALEALEIGPGDKVITTPFTFTATAEVIRYLGADPVFVDVDSRTLNIDPDEVARVLGSGVKAKALIPVHFAGLSCDMARLMAIAEEAGIAVVEDAAHALPCVGQGKAAGTWGAAGVFSFYATKTLCTGEGGMLVTESDDIARRARAMRLHGISRDVFDRYRSKTPSWYYEVVAPGFKYNMPDMAAAMGLEQLKKVGLFQQTRARIAEAYSSAFADLPLQLPAAAEAPDLHSWHLYVIRLNLSELTVSRERFIELMAQKGIGTSVHFIPLHLQPYWRDHYKLSADAFPVSSEAYRGCVSLPIHTRMTPQDVERVVQAVREVLTEGRRAV
jgi:dTDP-4-amino-4,6-dideoxygalactose transaminase